MKVVSDDFDAKSKLHVRRIQGKVEVDWDKNGTFTDESDHLIVLEYERLIQEPLGGVQLAQFDVQLANHDDRFSPRSSSPIVDYLIKDRPGKLSVGFKDAGYLQVVKGASDNPKVLRTQRQMRLHFFDELDKIQGHKLSGGGELFLNARTDRYIWGILDDVYVDFFKVICSCDTGETTWTGGSQETTNHRGGTAARKLQSTAGALATAYREPTVALDLSGYLSTDLIDFFLYVEDISKLALAELRFETTAGSDYYAKDITSLLSQEWNELSILKSAFTTTGSPNWNSIARITLRIQATTGQDVFGILDELRIRSAKSYPRRHFDIGLQFIPTAWWGGNTALFEIKTACEAESAKFFSDEDGELHFENRQHYNNNDEYKHSVHQFAWDRMTDFTHPDRIQEIINHVVVVLKPRVVQAEQDVWLYGFIPQIGAGVTKTIWAALQDPCPTTTAGIVQPAATTDYTANTQADGGGTDKTAQISIVITRFTNAVILEVTNNDASAVYLTKLKLRGTPAKEQDEVIIDKFDQTSIDAYGEHPAGGYSIENKYLSDETYAGTLAQQLIDWYKEPLDRIILKARNIPQLQIGDMITIRNDDIDANFLMRVIHIKAQLDVQNGFNQEIDSRAVVPFELLTFFEIGTSEIAGTDVIAP